ncbi:hypothetical protein QQS21_010337 [Conoideocrella luteorostrata]|uniref:DUF3669 domain-containing protein n=1 Tax=Conoideocrella luteorostrata TaxID=1105319 RepID=A0AAJ0CF84_9HYPO|nr:hypothetical protein QQS21_010337 [Conoideocrella luteorostrata]
MYTPNAEGQPETTNLYANQRRLLNATDSTVSSRSFSLDVALVANLALEDKLEKEASTESNDACLKRMLSIKSVVSTSSSFAARQQQATGTSAMFREIGTGSIGKVFEHPRTVFVYKLPLANDASKLWNNYKMHQRVKISFESLPYVDGQVEIPECFWYATSNSTAFWDDHINLFAFSPQFPKQRREVLCMERIFPLPRPVRYSLIEKYCPPQGRSMAKTNEANKDCLVRPYLGRVKYGSGSNFFSLRNFKLHANQMQDLDLDMPELINAMAHAMAVLHWHTRIDGNDVEFVLGSSPMQEQQVRGRMDLHTLNSYTGPTSNYEKITHSRADFAKRLTSLWMIDFDDCSDISMNQDGVEKAVKAFVDTNHYCPRPNSGNNFIQQAWYEFGKRYLDWSAKILEKTNFSNLKDYPLKFLVGVHEKTRKQEPAAGPSQGGRGKRR